MARRARPSSFEHIGRTSLSHWRAGKRVGCSVVEAFGDKPKPQELEQVLRLEYRSKLLNPKVRPALEQASAVLFLVWEAHRRRLECRSRPLNPKVPVRLTRLAACFMEKGFRHQRQNPQSAQAPAIPSQHAVWKHC